VNDIFYFMLSYIIILVVAYVLINFLSNGFFNVFIAVKVSRGKKTLVKVHGVADTYFRVGKVDETEIVFKDRRKNTRRIQISKEAIYRAAGVYCVDINDSNNCVLKPDGSAVQGFDAIKHENLYIRCLTRPNIINKKDQIKLFLMVLVILGAIGFVVYQNILLEEKLLNLAQAINKLGVVR